MKVKEKIVNEYVAKDGKVFMNKEACERYERWIGGTSPYDLQANCCLVFDANLHKQNFIDKNTTYITFNKNIREEDFAVLADYFEYINGIRGMDGKALSRYAPMYVKNHEDGIWYEANVLISLLSQQSLELQSQMRKIHSAESYSKLAWKYLDEHKENEE